MSASFPVFDPAVRHFLAALQPETALDIGAGAGKFGRMLREAAPRCDSLALEIRDEFVQRFDLQALYGRVANSDAAQWWRTDVDECFDLVIAGDVLQQMAKSDGLDLLNAMVYRAAWLIVVVPEFVVQGAVEGAPSAVHRSVWSERDFHWHDLWAWDNLRASTLLLLRGYQPSPIGIDAIVRQVNEGQVPLLDFDGQGVVRPLRLRLVDQGREVAYRPR